MRPLRFFPFLALLAVVALAAGCGGGGKKSVPSDAVAVVASDNITKSQFTLLINGTQRQYAARKTPFPKAGTSQYKALQDQTMAYLVQQSELEQKAKGLGVNVSDKDVQARIKQIKKQYFAGNEKKYQQQLKAQGLTEPLLALNLRGQILSEKLYTKVTGDVKISDAEIKTYYDAHKSTYAKAESRDVRHILVNNKIDPSFQVIENSAVAVAARALDGLRPLPAFGRYRGEPSWRNHPSSRSTSRSSTA